MGFGEFLKRVVPWGRGQRPAEGKSHDIVFKAHTAGGVETQALQPEDKTSHQQFGAFGALEPPLDFHRLCTLLFTSNALRPNIEAYQTNIDAVGWRLETTIDLFGPNAETKITEFLTVLNNEAPDDALVAETLNEWRTEALREKMQLDHFFEFANFEETWTNIRKKFRMDYELLGNGAIEIVRDRAKRIVMLNHVPFVTVRMLPLSRESIAIRVPQKVNAVTLREVTVHKRFRRFVQIQEGLVVWFKELGDPRVMSARTGKFFQTERDLIAKEPGSRPANEILHLKLHAPNQAYGMPRWIGNLVSVMGSRSSEEVNFRYFDNKSIPPIAIIFDGGRLASDSTNKIEDFIENHIKGEENFHKILILEAEPADTDDRNTGRGRIKIEKLTDVQQQDALFQNYDRNNRGKIGSSFRLPAMLRGELEGLNRATADVAKPFAEEQVFGPERKAFDDEINRKLMPRLGARFWLFKTRTPPTRDPQTLTEVLVKLVKEGILMPDEARLLLPDILGMDIAHRDDDFFREPMKLAIARLRARAMEQRRNNGANGVTPNGNGQEPNDAEQVAEFVAEVKAAVERRRKRQVDHADDEMRRFLDSERESEVESDKAE